MALASCKLLMVARSSSLSSPALSSRRLFTFFVHFSTTNAFATLTALHTALMTSFSKMSEASSSDLTFMLVELGSRNKWSSEKMNEATKRAPEHLRNGLIIGKGNT